MIDYLPMDSEQDYQDWLARLSALPAQLGDYRALLKEGIARERTQAQIVMSRVPSQIQNLITRRSCRRVLSIKAFADMPESVRRSRHARDSRLFRRHHHR